MASMKSQDRTAPRRSAGVGSSRVSRPLRWSRRPPRAASRSAGAQDKATIKFWTHTHPPMIDQNKALIAAVPGGESGYRGPVQHHPEQRLRRPRCSPRWAPAPVRTSSTWMTTRCGRIYIPKGLVQPLDAGGVGYDSDRRAAEGLHSRRARRLAGRWQGLRSARASSTSPRSRSIPMPSPRPVSIRKRRPKSWDDLGTEGQKLVVKDGDTLTQRGFDFLYLHAGWYHNQLGTLHAANRRPLCRPGQQDGDGATSRRRSRRSRSGTT